MNGVSKTSVYGRTKVDTGAVEDLKVHAPETDLEGRDEMRACEVGRESDGDSVVQVIDVGN